MRRVQVDPAAELLHAALQQVLAAVDEHVVEQEQRAHLPGPAGGGQLGDLALVDQLRARVQQVRALTERRACQMLTNATKLTTNIYFCTYPLENSEKKL